MIVPVICAWMVQWYGYVLLVIGKVNRNELPGASEPELNAGDVEVTVWVTAPMFRQQTFAPRGTVWVPF